MLWNSESSLPSGMLPTILDRALGLPTQRWLDVDLEESTLYADDSTTSDNSGASAATASSAPR